MAGPAHTPSHRLFLLRSPHLTRAATRDAQVQKAIELMHGELSRRWTVAKLARAVGLSRPAFARRFVACTGSSPLKYLARLRMEQAAQILRLGDQGLSQVAELVGYDSEFAFNRAFKRHHGLAPGSFRRRERASHAPVFRAAA